MRNATCLLSAAVRPAPKIRKPTIGLEHFVQRQRVVSLWREILRSTKKIPNSSTKTELRSYARHEFERNRDVTDLGHIRYLISTGKTEFETMQRYIEELST